MKHKGTSRGGVSIQGTDLYFLNRALSEEKYFVSKG